MNIYKGRKFIGVFFSGKPIKYLICLLGFLCSLVLIKNAYVQPPPPSVPTYTWSAHGNTSYGVLRSSLSTSPNDYGRGNCAHCHEQHSSIGGSEPAPSTGDDAGPDIYLLFKMLWGAGAIPTDPQPDEFCYGCHVGTSSLQSGGLNNYLYSYRAGKDTSITCPGSVKESFQFITNAGASNPNCGSSNGTSHILNNIIWYLKNWPNFPSNVNLLNPCSGCHNPHRAQKDPHTTTGRFVGQKIVSAVSLPSDHSKDNNAWKLWGDDPGERMSDYASGYKYQAPCQSPWGALTCLSSPPSCIKCEPDGSSTQDGSNLFDTVTFCGDCHKNKLPSTRITSLLQKPGGARTQTFAINWEATVDQHGKNGDVGGSQGDTLKAPYSPTAMGSGNPNYVLSCLDCHEPHGSPNEYLLREEVNGTKLPIITQTGRWCDWCKGCHNAPHGTSNCGGFVGACWNCHYHGATAMGGGSF